MAEDHSPIHSKNDDRNFFENVSNYTFCILTTINNSKYPKLKKKDTFSFVKNVKFLFYPTFPQFSKKYFWRFPGFARFPPSPKKAV